MKKLRYINPDGREYQRLAVQLALSRVQVYPCRDCGGPVIKGCCCERCGSTNPSPDSAP